MGDAEFIHDFKTEMEYVTDKREQGYVLHSLEGIILTVIFGIFAKCNTIEEVWLFMDKHYKWLDEHVGYEGENSLPAYKLNTSRVLGAYFVNVGNGGNLFFVFIKENGKVAYLSYNSMIYEGKIVIKDINELSNIVSIVYNDMVPYAVDINGNEVELYKYINY